jgi:CPA1 family monovalent cation:H+ antiporter
MTNMQFASLLIVIAACISYLNQRLFKLPGKTGHFLLSFVFVVLIIISEKLASLALHDQVREIIASINFQEILVGGMLSILLFSGGLHTPLRLLKQQKRLVFALAFLTTLINTFIVAGALWGIAQLINIQFDFLHALIFGALISPTDPLTALAVLEKIGLPRRLKNLLLGESLFNDGIGLVLFIIFSSFSLGKSQLTWYSGLQLFVLEIGGGIAIGLIIAMLTHYLITTIQDVYTHIIITIAAILGGYTLCVTLHISGPIAMATFGIIAGNITFKTAISRAERQEVHFFWTVIDEILTSVLFVLIGLQLVRIPMTQASLIAAIVAISVVLCSRFISVISAVNLMFIEKPCSKPQLGIVNLLTWGGLRGGLSIAMVFSLPENIIDKALILNMTFAVVAFSILVQGLSIKYFFPQRKLLQLAFEESKNEN